MEQRVKPEASYLGEVTRHEIAAWVLMALVLFLVLRLNLLPALIGGLLVYELVHILAPKLRLWRLDSTWSKIVAVGMLSTIVVTLLTLGVFGVIALLRSDVGSPSGLVRELAKIIDQSKNLLPLWAVEKLPENADELRTEVVEWLRVHAKGLQSFGTGAARALAQLLIGMIIGALISLGEARRRGEPGPLAQALTERVARLGEAFRRIVFAQVRISALNTTLTAIYLAIVLPLFGVHLPFVKTMIVVTFLVGLMPVIGNLISNTVIVIISLSHSLYVALGSLAFLIIIHKLEYFFNARIIGTQIRSRAWELLVAMLAMEAAFGVAGVIAAPIYYAYVKDELANRNQI
jgi:predicted PurR-regulated permease PerM